ncbi:MAG: Maf family protein [Chthoniobacterales bacterium]
MRNASEKLVLASASPRRRELLMEAGFEFEIARPQGVESESTELSMRELTTLNAARKALEIARNYPAAVVLAADTLVSLEGNVISKPVDFADAIRIIQRLRGRTHQVCTSVFVCARAAARTKSFFVVSHVTFRSLDDTAIVRYLEKINPLDKAGAYAAQGNGAEIIESIRGSYTNVVGLPMEETIRALREFGVVARDYSLGATR